MSILGVILAGGKARRMGGIDKGRLKIGDASILEIITKSLDFQLDKIVLNANGDLGRFSDLEIQVIPDTIQGYVGPLAGILSGMRFAEKNSFTSILTVASDTPFFPTDLVSKLSNSSAKENALISLSATKQNDKIVRHPTFGLWSVSLADDLEKHIHAGLRKIVLWADKHSAKTVLFPSVKYDPFFNINTQSELEEAQRRIKTF
jgi:molybdopterin-guanine dinucleotide biosynthesis protein A